MFEWIAGNYVTVIAILVLAAVIAGAVWSVVRDKKKGRSSCGAGCANCPMHGSCHKAK